MVQLHLETGARIVGSANHPTADGRLFGDLVVGDRLDDVEIESVEVTRYAHDHTYDILPASDSGVYFIGGIAIGSTLH
jgi:hypothetical protein